MSHQRYSYLGMVIVLALSACIVYLLVKFTSEELGWTQRATKEIVQCAKKGESAIVIEHVQRVECYEP